jgi:FtsH-binding integral membrane protein
MVVEQASMGDGDFVGHAVKLYTDLVAVFIRIAAILAKNSNRKRERN